jgi:hypothetical protein
LQKRPIDDIAAQQIDIGQWDKDGYPSAEDAAHNHSQVEISSLLIDIQFKLSNFFIHVFLQDFSLLLLEIRATRRVFILEEEEPDYEGIDNHVIDVDN